MPASRARGTQWQRTLQQLCDRDGAIELALAPSEGNDDAERGDLIWRVRIQRVTDDEIVVDPPRALGRLIAFTPGTALLGAVVIGPNRWTFPTRVLSRVTPQGVDRGGSLTLEAPESLERCQRRHGRYDARALRLPTIDLWPLLDPSSVVHTQRAADPLIRAALAGERVDASVLDGLQPEVGPSFKATVMNIGGGGLGVRVEPADASILSRHPVLWARLPLGAAMPVPILATTKVIHTHLDSAQFTYAGLAFDFSFYHPAQRLVADQILFVIAAQQKQRPLRAA
ncbi:MAG: hypothetical protein KF724_02820 [Phycisphaeraceae bacterium]|nr:hypothetical protein [Phycisphaeraceae bacterium]